MGYQALWRGPDPRVEKLIVVAHRLSTVRHAHRIWVLDAGRVIEAGTHDELLAGDGAYAALWRVQTGEVTPARQPG